MVVGTNDEDMSAAVNEVARLNGGLCVVCGGQVQGSMELPIGGLMSEWTAEEVMSRLDVLTEQARSLGVQMEAPFRSLSFVSRPTVPDLGLTDKGLVDVPVSYTHLDVYKRQEQYIVLGCRNYTVTVVKFPRSFIERHLNGMNTSIDDDLSLIHILTKQMHMDKESAAAWTSLELILLSIISTGLNLYPKLVKFGGAGALVPITGFANSVAAPAVEFHAEGQVFGIGVKIFTIAGPVILYGILSSWALGVVYWIGRMMGII